MSGHHRRKATKEELVLLIAKLDKNPLSLTDEEFGKLPESLQVQVARGTYEKTKAWRTRLGAQCDNCKRSSTHTHKDDAPCTVEQAVKLHGCGMATPHQERLVATLFPDGCKALKGAAV